MTIVQLSAVQYDYLLLTSHPGIFCLCMCSTWQQSTFYFHIHGWRWEISSTWMSSTAHLLCNAVHTPGMGHCFGLLFTVFAACLTTSLTCFTCWFVSSAFWMTEGQWPTSPTGYHHILEKSNQHDLSSWFIYLCKKQFTFLLLMCSVALPKVLYLSKLQFPYL